MLAQYRCIAIPHLHRLCDLLQGETPQEMAGLAEAMQLKAVSVHTSCDGDSHFLLQQTCMQCLFHMLCFSILHELAQPALHDLMSQQACNKEPVCQASAISMKSGGRQPKPQRDPGHLQGIFC